MPNDQKLPDNIGLAGMLIQSEYSFLDQADVLEQEGVLEQAYTLLSNGVAVGYLAQALGMTVDRMKNILKSSTLRTKRYNAARLNKLADKSFDALDLFSVKNFLLKEESSAARHHLAVIQAATNALGREGDEGNGSKIVMNTQINYGTGMEKPELPHELENILEN